MLDQLIGALTERVDPSGTKEVTIRKYGAGQIEIIIPKAKPEDLEFIERRIYTAGSLEFRITASPKFVKHRDIIERAKRLPSGVKELRQGDQKIAEWVEYSVEQFGPVDLSDDRIVKRMAGNTPQALVLTDDGLDVTGDDLEDSRAGFGQRVLPKYSSASIRKAHSSLVSSLVTTCRILRGSSINSAFCSTRNCSPPRRLIARLPLKV